MRVKCVTINLQGLADDWIEHRFAIAVEDLKREEPDVLAMQEAAIRRYPVPYDQARMLAQAVGLPYLAFTPYGHPAEMLAAEHIGVALASRWPLAAVRSIHLPGAPERKESRAAMLVQLAGGGDLKFVVTHLSWPLHFQSVRLMQMELILEHLNDEPWRIDDKGPIFMGDLNGVESEPAIRLLSSRLTDSYRSVHTGAGGATWSNANRLAKRHGLPDRRIDYIFVPPVFDVNDAHVCLDGLEPDVASDHFGVAAEVVSPESALF